MPIRYADYNPGFRKLSKQLRAYGYCHHCYAENGRPHPKTGKPVVLTVAHLNHVETDDRPENLAVLCQRCHLRYDREDNARRRKYGKRYRKQQFTLNL